MVPEETAITQTPRTHGCVERDKKQMVSVSFLAIRDYIIIL
jgi:hypothetical protein